MTARNERYEIIATEATNCHLRLTGLSRGRAAPSSEQAATVASYDSPVSHDGANTWSEKQITPAAKNGQRTPTDGRTVRTDSHGTAYVFGRRHRLVAGT